MSDSEREDLVPQSNPAGRGIHQKAGHSSPFRALFVALAALAAVLALGALIASALGVSQLGGMSDTLDDVSEKLDDGRNPTINYYNETIFNNRTALPLSKFAVYAAGPVRDQMSRGTCWDFATMRFMEERYRQQAMAKGYLADDKYVRFSEQAYGRTLIQFCRDNPEKCPDTPTASGSATDGYTSWIYHFQDYLHDKLTVDLDSCPYLPTEGHDEDCGGQDEFLEVSPIDYSATNFKPLYGISDIKKKLSEANSTFPLVTELFFMPYYVPCDVPRFGYSATTQCLEKRFPCPEDMQTAQNLDEPRYCARLTLMTDAQGHFLVRPHRQPVGGLGAHAMLLVGYNDDYAFDVDSSGRGNSRGKSKTRGGFIVQNSWNAGLSHSIDWFMNKISMRDEQYMCPNIEAPAQWVPVDSAGDDMYKLRSTTILRYHADSRKIWHHHADEEAIQVLGEALAPVLDESKYYALHHIEDSIDGTVRVYLVSYASAADAREDKRGPVVALPPMPLDILPFYVTPDDVDKAPNSQDMCGYFLIPYELVEEVLDKTGVWWVATMDVEFTDESFVKPGLEEQDGYEQISEATRTHERMEWTTHTPWLQDPSLHPRV